MREIKFQFIYKGLPYRSGSDNFNWHKKVYTLDQLMEKPLRELSDVHGQAELIAKRQYTGLKDKGGVEIYEGDIFKCDEGKFRVEYISEYMAFCPFTEEQWGWFKNGSNHFKYCFDEDRRAGKRHFLSMYEPYEIEVIGNIHENPELRDGGKDEF